MKKLSISLALISMLAISQTSFAELSETPSQPESSIETIVVIGTPEVANFEIYSEKHSALAMNEMMDIVVASYDENTKNLENSAEI